MLWATSERPQVLVSGDGKLVGVQTELGRAISHEKGGGFAVRSWLENDGDGATQAQASGRRGVERARGLVRVELAGLQMAQIRSAKIDASAACGEGMLLLVPELWDRPAGGCIFYGKREFLQSGALAIYARKDGLEIVSARAEAGRRLWLSRCG